MAGTKFATYFELPEHGVPKYSRKHLIDLQRRGQFPKARQISPNRIAWVVDEIERWVASRPVGKNYRTADDEGKTAPVD